MIGSYRQGPQPAEFTLPDPVERRKEKALPGMDFTAVADLANVDGIGEDRVDLPMVNLHPPKVSPDLGARVGDRMYAPAIGRPFQSRPRPRRAAHPHSSWLSAPHRRWW
jgi:hypothetical protein